MSTPTDDPGTPDLDQRLRTIFTEPTMSLPIPPGQWDRVVGEARRRRRRGQMFVLSTAAAVVLLAGAVASVAPRLTGGSTATRGSATSQISTAAQGGEQSAPAPATSAGVGGAGLPAGAWVPAGFHPTSVTTAADGVLYALGRAPCATSPCTSLVRSTDWGRHWVGLQPPRVALSVLGTPALSTGTVTDVRFANPRDGWVFGGGLWSTHDGAASTATWRRIDLGATVLDLATDGRQVWAFVASCTASQCRDGRLLASPVGADHFTAVDGVAVPGELAGARLNATAGAVTLTVSGPQPLLFVRDANRWAARATPCQAGPGMLQEAVPSAVDPAVVVATCATAGAGQVSLTTYVALDSGVSWHRTGNPVRVRNGAHQLAVVDAGLLALAAGSTAGGGALLVSQDSGAAWHPAAVPIQQDGWAWVGAAGGRVLLALPVSGERLWMSTDGGQSWRALTVR